MQIINKINFDPKSAITIGTFDGLHLGHLQIINELVAYSSTNKLRSVVISFHPHPQEVLQSRGSSVDILTTMQEREDRLKALGVNEVVWLQFNAELANTDWLDFCNFLQTSIGFSHIVFGHDHAFGKNREGNFQKLQDYGITAGFTAYQVAPFVLNSEVISSTKIRKALMQNDLENANKMLGYSYTLSGIVIRGDGRGKEIGFPTANILPLDRNKLLPANGVYGVDISIQQEDSKWSKPYRAMMNIGVRPTFTLGTEKTIEAHIFDFDKEIYSLAVNVKFLIFARHELKFASKDEFLAQLAKDALLCKAYK